MFGYDAGVLAGVQDTEPFLSAIGHPERRSTVIIPMVASAYTLGAWVMSMAVSFIGSSMGRRNCILSGNILVIVGGALQASTFSVAQIIVGRVLCVRIIFCFGFPPLLTLDRDLGSASYHLLSQLIWCVPLAALFMGIYTYSFLRQR